MNRPDPPAGVSKFGASTSRRNPSVRAVRPTHRAAQQFLGAEEQSRNTLDALTFHRVDGTRVDPPKPAKTAAEIRAESKAFVENDPGMQAFLSRKRAGEVGNAINELMLEWMTASSQHDEGELDDLELAHAQVEIAQRLWRISPEALEQLATEISTQHENGIEEWRQARVEQLISSGYEPWHANEIADEELDDQYSADLPGDQLKRAVGAKTITENNARVGAAHAGIAQKSDDAFMSVAKELVNAGDRESEARFLHTKQWIAESGIDLEQLVANGEGEQAGAYLRSAYAQQDALDREEAVSEMKRQIMEAPSTNIADGLSEPSKADKAQEELLEAIRTQNELKLIEMGVSLPTARGIGFDPEWQPEPTAAQTADPSLDIRLLRDEKGNVVRNPETGAVIAAPGAVDEAADANSKLTKYGYSDQAGRPISEDDASELVKGSLESGIHGLSAR